MKKTLFQVDLNWFFFYFRH